MEGAGGSTGVQRWKLLRLKLLLYPLEFTEKIVVRIRSQTLECIQLTFVTLEAFRLAITSPFFVCTLHQVY